MSAADDVPSLEPRPFREAVGAVVRAVPAGRVASYGTVARLAGRPGAARRVGAALQGLAAADEAFPWHRVVGADGGIRTYRVGAGELQEALLRREGVAVRDGRVDMARHAVDDDAARGSTRGGRAGTRSGGRSR